MTASDDWAAVADSIGRLTLKLKLHFEETAGESAAEARKAVEAAGDGVEAAFDGLKELVSDPAVQEDLRDVAAGLRDAVSNSFAELRTQLDVG
jgi:hypothetical protein